MRDNEVTAGSVGVAVTRAKRIVYLVSAAGCGAAGGVLLVSSLNVRPDSAFSIQWSAYMIFIVVIGGLGSIEGPLLGAIIFFALQQTLADYGVWYLVILGAIGIAAAMYLPRGLWGFDLRSHRAAAVPGRLRCRPSERASDRRCAMGERVRRADPALAASRRPTRWRPARSRRPS